MKTRDLTKKVAEIYPHRTRESINQIEADEILEEYLNQKGVNELKHHGSNFPYHAAVGRTSESEGYITITSHFTYPEKTGFSEDQIRASLTMDNIGAALEDNLIDEETILDASGAEIIDETQSPEIGREISNTESVYCLVFYDKPVISVTEEKDYETQAHKSAAMEALREPSLATAFIHQGPGSNNKDLADVMIDYWTRSFDGIEEEGFDYAEIDWRDSWTKI